MLPYRADHRRMEQRSGRRRSAGGARRRRARGLTALFLGGLLSSCAVGGPTAGGGPAATWTGSASTPPPPAAPESRVAVDTAAVLARVSAVASELGAVVGAVTLSPAGEVLVESPDAARAMPAASLVKLLVVQRLLAQQDAGGPPLAPDVAERMERAITVSDDPAMGLLWTQYDGPALVREAAAEFGLEDTAPPADVGQWGNTSTSARDLARFLARLSGDVPAAGSAQLLEWMRAAQPTAADGFDQRFGLLSGAAGPGVGAKQGWACCPDGRRQLHSVGVLADGRVVALLVDAPESVSYAQARSVIDESTAALVAGTA